MAAATSSNQQQPHVVQAIFDSLTRCFHPLDEAEESAFSNRCPRQQHNDSPKTSRHGAAAFDDGGANRTKSRRSSSGAGSASEASQAVKSPYDADRYLSRKLEIFRTTDEELAEMGLPPRRPGRSSSRSRGHRRDRSVNTLVYSSDDEIATLTRNQKRTEQDGRGVQGGCAARNDGSGPIAAFAKLLTDPFSCISHVQRPLGLCFATPVREADEEVSNMSDWKLTAAEFAARHVDGPGRFRCSKLAKASADDDDDDDTAPDVDDSSGSVSQDEEETITSASYFDQKYSHIQEKNPPMPLFREQRIAVSESETDEIFKIVKRRRQQQGNVNSRGSPPRKPSSGEQSPHPRQHPRSSPTNEIIVKKSNKSGGGGSFKSRRSSSKQPHDGVPMGKSSSVSSAPSHDGDGNHENHRAQGGRSRLREPDIVYSTAAGI